MIKIDVFKISVESLTLHLKIPGYLKCSAEIQPECTSCQIVIDLCLFLQTPIVVRKQSAIYYEVWSLILPLH